MSEKAIERLRQFVKARSYLSNHADDLIYSCHTPAGMGELHLSDLIAVLDGPKHSTDLLAMYRMVRMEKFGFWDDCDEEHKETLREMSRRLCFATKHSAPKEGK